jgi:transcriptional regulator with XRE-family HTH domain
MARARKATKSLWSKEHRALCALLIETREKAGLYQAEVAKRLGKPQSFVSKYESGERRLDVIEFIAVVAALGADPVAFLRHLLKKTGG